MQTQFQYHSPASNESVELMRSQNQRSALYKGVVYKNLKEICKNEELRKETILFGRIVCHLCLEPSYDFLLDSKNLKPVSEDLIVRIDPVRLASLIKEPSIHDHTLEFYVTQVGTGVPFRVKVDLDNPHIKIEGVK